MTDTYLIIIIILLLVYILFCPKSNNETFGNESSTNTEAIKNVASLYNTQSMSVSNLNITGSLNILPKGSIIMWIQQSPPEGWAICDGQNGTPDLRGRFVRMWNDKGFSQKYNWHGGAKLESVKVKSSSAKDSLRSRKRGVGDSYLLKHHISDRGGSDIYELTNNELAPHTHNFKDAFFSEHWGSQKKWGNKLPGSKSGFDWDNAPWTVNNVTDSTGKGYGHSTQPPYHVLSFIMKL